MKILLSINFLFLFIGVKEIYAEYRVYQYQIEDISRKGLKGSTQIITSTLNPRSYLSYHGGGLAQRIDLLRSWHCYGHTGGMRKFCDPPLSILNLEQTGEN